MRRRSSTSTDEMEPTAARHDGRGALPQKRQTWSVVVPVSSALQAYGDGVAPFELGQSASVVHEIAHSPARGPVGMHTVPGPPYVWHVVSTRQCTFGVQYWSEEHRQPIAVHSPGGFS